jgi:hypothetical protein
MPLPFDATLKDLVQTHTHDIAAAFGLEDPQPVSVLNVDLSTVTAATDIVLGFGDPLQWLVDLNFQSSRAEDLLARVMLYNALLYHRFRVPVHSLVVLLRQEAQNPTQGRRLSYQVRPRRGKMDFSFEILPLWRRPVRQLLGGGLGTLPLAPLGRLPTGVPVAEALPGVIRRIEGRLTREATPEEANRLLTASFVLTGLRLSRDEAVHLFRGVRAMRESTTYQYILDEGRIEEARAMLLRQGRIRFGPPGEQAEAVLAGISDLDRLRRMGERLVQAGTWQEVLDTL